MLALAQAGLEDGGPDESGWQGFAPLSDQQLKVHIDLLLRQVVADAGVRRCLNERHARAGRSPRRREVGACGEPEGLTARARGQSWGRY